MTRCAPIRRKTWLTLQAVEGSFKKKCCEQSLATQDKAHSLHQALPRCCLSLTYVSGPRSIFPPHCSRQKLILARTMGVCRRPRLVAQLVLQPWGQQATAQARPACGFSLSPGAAQTTVNPTRVDDGAASTGRGRVPGLFTHTGRRSTTKQQQAEKKKRVSRSRPLPSPGAAQASPPPCTSSPGTSPRGPP